MHAPIDLKAKFFKLPFVRVKILARVPESLRGSKPVSGKLLLWDSSLSAIAKNIKPLNGEEVQLEFEVSNMKLEYVTIGERFDLFLAVDERREGYSLRRWMPAYPLKVEVLG